MHLTSQIYSGIELNDNSEGPFDLPITVGTIGCGKILSARAHLVAGETQGTVELTSFHGSLSPTMIGATFSLSLDNGTHFGLTGISAPIPAAATGLDGDRLVDEFFTVTCALSSAECEAVPNSTCNILQVTDNANRYSALANSTHGRALSRSTTLSAGSRCPDGTYLFRGGHDVPSRQDSQCAWQTHQIDGKKFYCQKPNHYSGTFVRCAGDEKCTDRNAWRGNKKWSSLDAYCNNVQSGRICQRYCHPNSCFSREHSTACRLLAAPAWSARKDALASMAYKDCYLEEKANKVAERTSMVDLRAGDYVLSMDAVGQLLVDRVFINSHLEEAKFAGTMLTFSYDVNSSLRSAAVPRLCRTQRRDSQITVACPSLDCRASSTPLQCYSCAHHVD